MGDVIQVAESTEFQDLIIPGGPTHAVAGQFLHKIYHSKREIPRWAKALAPKGTLEIHEKMWTAFPFARAEFSNPGFLKERLYIRLDSVCVADRGESENVHRLSPEQLKRREVVYLDIANDPFSEDYTQTFDPRNFTSNKTQRGPFTGPWKETVDPVMCCYKLLVMDFRYGFGLQERVEKYAAETESKCFLQFYRQMICTMDTWLGMTSDDIKKLESELAKECEDSMGKPKEKRFSLNRISFAKRKSFPPVQP